METDEALNPITIRSFGPKAVVFQAQDIARVIEELFRLATGDGCRYDYGRYDRGFSNCPIQTQPRYTDFICN
jgi:hypothetical protein